MHTEADETERLRFNREYFENGCACLLRDKLFDKVGEECTDKAAVMYYEQSCVCSRNYIDKEDE